MTGTSPQVPPGSSFDADILRATLLPSVLRTVVPIVYAMLVRWGVTEWLDPDDMFVTNLITVLVTASFYVGLRLLEKYRSRVGWLLGYAQQPVYVKGEVINVTEVATPPTTTTEVETTESTLPDEGVTS